MTNARQATPSNRVRGSTRFPRLHCIYRWTLQFGNVFVLLRAFKAISWYIRDWYVYSRLPNAELLCIIDSFPQLHDRTASTPFDAHYYYMSGWAMRRITANRPASHVDVGSLILFSNLLGAIVPVTFVDLRPLEVTLGGLTSVSGSILNLPFPTATIVSLSCLHVAEHIAPRAIWRLIGSRWHTKSRARIDKGLSTKWASFSCRPGWQISSLLQCSSDSFSCCD